MMAARVRGKPPPALASGLGNNHDFEPLVACQDVELVNDIDVGGRSRRDDDGRSKCDDVARRYQHEDEDDGPYAYEDDDDDEAAPFRQRRRLRRRRRAETPTTWTWSLPAESLMELLRGCLLVRAAIWVRQLTRHECNLMIVVVVVTTGVSGLVQFSIHGRIVPWQMVGIIALTVVLFVKDRKRASVRFVVPWLALLLLVAAPVLSGSAIAAMAVMVALPLQLIIHRLRHDVTLETCKVPPSARVKAIDVLKRSDDDDDKNHSLLALAYYTGHVVLWRVSHAPTTRTSSTATAPGVEAARGLEVCHQQPLRSVRFCAHHPSGVKSSSYESDRGTASLLVAGDDGRLVQVDAATLSVERTVQAHSDFCRCVEVHPTHPVILTASDDNSIKLWASDATDPTNQFTVRQVLEGHDDFVMVVKCHPDGTSFVSASLDTTIRKWTFETSAYDVSVPSSAPSTTFRGHSQGVNCLDFIVSSDNDASTVLVSGSDDLSIKLWDYSSGALIRSISQAHLDNVNAMLVHPRLPLLISACEGGICHVWNVGEGTNEAADISLQDTWNLDKGRAWSLAWVGNEDVAIGFDQGCGIVRIQSEGSNTGNSDPSISGAPNRCAQVRWLSHVEFVSSTSNSTEVGR